MPPREWDASSYDRMSDPQLAMARDVIDRLDLRGDERVLDAGCGTGRVTEVLAQRVPAGTVIAVDGSQKMVDEYGALKSGGKLVARCGGAGNVADVQRAIDAVNHPTLRGWEVPWNFARRSRRRSAFTPGCPRVQLGAFLVVQLDDNGKFSGMTTVLPLLPI